MRVISSAITDIGRIREINEDYYLVRDEDSLATKKYGKLYIVCDGMGGHNAGEVASKKSAEEFANIYLSDKLKETDIEKRIKASIDHTNRKVYELSRDNPKLQGMGTTIVGLVVTKEKAYVFNVGDSRCYLIDKNKIEQLSEDHSLVNELIKAKIMGKEEAKISDKKNIITRAVGTNEKVEPFIKTVSLAPNIKFLLCTDGLSNMVNDDEIKHVVEENSPAKALNKLITLANERGGLDNITAIEVEVEKGKVEKKILIAASAVAIALLLFAFFAFHINAYSNVLLEARPRNATIYFDGKSYLNECPIRLKKNSSVTVSVKKNGFETEKISIFSNNGKLSYQIEGINKSITGSKLLVNLKKLVNFKLVDSAGNNITVGDAILTVDGESFKTLKGVPLPLGKHAIKVSSTNYYEVDKTIDIKEDTDTINILLKEIPLFTLDSEPQGAYIEVYDNTNHKSRYLKDSKGNLLATPCKIDFNKIKGKEVHLVKNTNTPYIYFKELKLQDLSDIPEDKIHMGEYVKVSITSDIENAKFYDCFGDELNRLSGNIFFVQDNSASVQICIKGEAEYNNYSVEVEKRFSINEIKDGITFNFKILRFTDNGIELINDSSFRGSINNNIPIRLNEVHNKYSINTTIIKTITGYNSSGFKYIYVKGGTPYGLTIQTNR